jgi:hypothetical protein
MKDNDQKQCSNTNLCVTYRWEKSQPLKIEI